MNGLKQMNHAVKSLARMMTRGMLCGLLALGWARTGLATVDTYQNDAVLNYTVPPQALPTIDATNFINNNSFTINFAGLTVNTEFYEPRNVINYVNNGAMAVNTGFQFDTLPNSNTHQMAGSFYNGGTINCASITDTNAVFFLSAGQCFVSATNLVNPGLINVGGDGLLQLTGQNVDLSRGALSIEGLSLFTSLGSPGVTGLLDAFGTDTNGEWMPSTQLTATSAAASAPVFLTLNNTTPYINVVTNSSSSGTNVVVRAVFLTNPSLNVTNNVYFGTSGVGGGFATIEWLGSYLDSASGQTITNYLYLNDDYVLGSTTNVLVVNGVPNNFTFLSSLVQLTNGIAATNGFRPGFAFNPGNVTNTYSYVDAQLIATTVGTNASPANPSGALTNLPGRIQITANQELNLALAQISGQNYLSLTCTNQFDGNDGAQISSPYSDIHLGVTNGFLTVSNLLESALPNWSGEIQAWSGRWIFVDVNGITNDYRVLLVSSQITPTTTAQVQDLILHATNSVVISDVLNVMRTLSIDAQNLTLTTNGFGVGAGSLRGELNWGPVSIFGPTQLPNLRQLTNNGAIHAPNLAVFGSPAAPYGAFVNNGLISDQGTTIWATNVVLTGTVNNGSGGLMIQSSNTTITGGLITSSSDTAITAGSLLVSNLTLSAGRSLTLQATNLLTDTGGGNGNVWSFTGSSAKGLNLPIKPAAGDLLGTTIMGAAPAPSVNVPNFWAGQDRGAQPSGYANNAAVGRLVLDALGNNSLFTFSGTSSNNAIYVDYLQFLDKATNLDQVRSNLTALAINTNMVIYYAQAVLNGVSVAQKINHWNTNRLRWVSGYAGYYSSTNIVYGGMTNTVNAALLQSTNIDSNGNGIPNASDPSPFFLSSQVNFTVTLTNVPPLNVLLQWQSIPSATNYVFYKTNLLLSSWLTLTNFVTPVLPPSPPVTVTALDPVNFAVPKYYQIRVDPKQP